MKYALEWVVTVLQYAVSFYGFWLVWRVLLPDLPGPADPEERIAPYVAYFTDPIVVPVANTLHIPTRAVALLALLLVAAVCPQHRFGQLDRHGASPVCPG